MGKEKGLGILCGLYSPCPASPPSPPTSLLVLSKPQGTLQEPLLPRPGGAPNNSKEEESGCHSRPPAWYSEDTALQTEFRSEVLTEPSSAPSPQSGGCVPQSPLVHPPLPRPELCPGVAGGAEAASAQRQGQVPANRLELGDSGGVSGPEGKDRNLSPRASPRNQHCAKHVHIHHLTQASQHICQPILQMKKLLEKIR